MAIPDRLFDLARAGAQVLGFSPTAQAEAFLGATARPAPPSLD